MGDLSGSTKEKKVPTYDSEQIVAEDLSKFYVEKITRIRNNLEQHINSTNLHQDNSIYITQDKNCFKNFSRITMIELEKCFLSMKKKTCDLDPAPTYLISYSFNLLKPLYLHIINTVIETSHFPTQLKHALVTPIIKDKNKNINELNNYRPVSNLPFLEKLIEKILHTQLEYYIETNNLHAKFQSAYRQHNSCETASIRIFGDIQELLVEKDYVALITLDSSAAFDTVDHNVLITKLKRHFKINGNALALIKSYLKDRTFSVVVGDEISTPKSLDCGVPQGSLLGPLLYILYTKEIQNIVKNCKIRVHMYADDCQLYLSFKSDTTISAQEKANNCLTKIKYWMDCNFLKLNPDKTTLKIFRPNKVPIPFQITYNKQIIQPIDIINILGVRIKNDMDFTAFISRKIQICHLHLRNLYHIRPCLTFKSRVTMVTNLVLSNLDYCNAILICSKKKEIKPLQLTLNRAMRFIFYLRLRTHITPFLKRLHILPIEFRIRYKTCLIAFKIFNKLAPSYLIDKFNIFRPSTSMDLRVGRGRDVFMFEEELNKADTIYTNIKSEWNQLPLQIRTINNINNFKVQLKTHFYRMAFESAT